MPPDRGYVPLSSLGGQCVKSALSRPNTTSSSFIKANQYQPLSLTSHLAFNPSTMSAGQSSPSHRVAALALTLLAVAPLARASYSCFTDLTYPYCVNDPSDGKTAMPWVLSLSGRGARGDASQVKSLVGRILCQARFNLLTLSVYHCRPPTTHSASSSASTAGATPTRCVSGVALWPPPLDRLWAQSATAGEAMADGVFICIPLLFSL